MIPEPRSGEARLSVLDRHGRPVADTDVVVRQRRHAFGFGNIAFDFVRLVGGPDPEGAESIEAFGGSAELDLDSYADRWLRLFNMATLPFYWGRYEPRRGDTDVDRLRRAARWLVDRDVTIKGHPLVWHTVQPDWLLGLPLGEVETLLRARVRDTVAAFAGTIDLWDAINEAVIMPVFANGGNAVTPLAAQKGSVEMVRLAVEEARSANPAVRLAINDFDLSPAYERLIEQVLEAGIRLDAIGLQTHMHQGYRGEEQVLAVVDRFARFGLPIQMTETTLVSGHLMPDTIEDLNDYRIPEWPTTPEGEDRQAEEIERHYRSLFRHPAVESITYWGFTDAGSWLGAPIGFVRSDGSEKPSYRALDRLINDEWWFAPTTLRTDAEGRLTVRGALGAYEVSAAGQTGAFELVHGGAVPAVRLVG
jgi:endo-1,4-beta-xylanase